MAEALSSLAMLQAWKQIAFVITLLEWISGRVSGTDIKGEFSTPLIILPIVWITSTGYFPTDVSPESITASAPSITEFATSLTSALEGVRLSIMDSIIWVAIIIGFRAFLALLTMSFCFKGTSSAGISRPKSPLATIKPSASWSIASRLRIASGFSILAIIGILCFEFWLISSSSSQTSSFDLTKESANQSKPFFIANKASVLSFSVRAGNESFVLGRFTPFLDFRSPPWITLVLTKSFLFVSRISKMILPSSTKTLSPFETSLGKSL